MKKKSIKKHLKVGSVIRTSQNAFWLITCLLENKFQCKPVDYIDTELEFTQEFYYNIDMIVFKQQTST